MPLGVLTLLANACRSAPAAAGSAHAQARHPWRQAKCLLEDKGYDALSNFLLLADQGIMPVIAVASPPIYRMRGAIERHFSSVKHSLLLNRRQHRTLARVSWHPRMATLACLVSALARLKADNYAGMRRMSIRRPEQRAVGVDGNPGLAVASLGLNGTEL